MSSLIFAVQAAALITTAVLLLLCLVGTLRYEAEKSRPAGHAVRRRTAAGKTIVNRRLVGTAA